MELALPGVGPVDFVRGGPDVSAGDPHEDIYECVPPKQNMQLAFCSYTHARLMAASRSVGS